MGFLPSVEMTNINPTFTEGFLGKLLLKWILVLKLSISRCP